MGLFERYLTVWVGLGILAGVGLGLSLVQQGRWQARLDLGHALRNAASTSSGHNRIHFSFSYVL